MAQADVIYTARREDIRAFLWLLCYSFILLLCLSPDSYLYDLYYHLDTAVFYMCGKAWMNGLVPYVDFTDSKGPLLWLIYGIGYLMSRHSYVGVFWISVLFYAVTLFAAYKLCRLYADKAAATVATALLPFIMFCYAYHFEVRAEDYCYPFVMLSLYATCRILKDSDCDGRTYFRLSALMGMCSMCCVMIKYNAGVMIMSLMAVVFYMSVRHKAGIRCIAGMAIGFVATALPIIICFIVYGNMGAFIHEYFFHTIFFIANNVMQGTAAYSAVGILLSVILLAGVVWCGSRLMKSYWIVPCFVFFVLCLGKGHWLHYYTILLPFGIFMTLAAADFAVSKVAWLRRHTAVVCALAAIVTVGMNLSLFVARRTTFNDEARQNYYTAAYIMSQVEKPTIMYNGLEHGLGIPAGSLPACKYWMMQWGATDDVVSEARGYVERGVPDFICLDNPNDEQQKMVERLGYVLYCKAPIYFTMHIDHGTAAWLYGRPGLRMPPSDFHVSQWDVWLKRNIFDI